VHTFETSKLKYVCRTEFGIGENKYVIIGETIRHKERKPGSTRATMRMMGALVEDLTDEKKKKGNRVRVTFVASFDPELTSEEVGFLFFFRARFRCKALGNKQLEFNAFYFIYGVGADCQRGRLVGVRWKGPRFELFGRTPRVFFKRGQHAYSTLPKYRRFSEWRNGLGRSRTVEERASACEFSLGLFSFKYLVPWTNNIFPREQTCNIPHSDTASFSHST